jgi:hypothetical protein
MKTSTDEANSMEELCKLNASASAAIASLLNGFRSPFRIFLVMDRIARL